jgi:hypothetical protein
MNGLIGSRSLMILINVIYRNEKRIHTKGSLIFVKKGGHWGIYFRSLSENPPTPFCREGNIICGQSLNLVKLLA